MQEAMRLLAEAAADVEGLWRRDDSLEWRANVSVLYGRTYGELAWCRVMLGDSMQDVQHASCLSKGRELVEHVTSFRRRCSELPTEIAVYIDG